MKFLRVSKEAQDALLIELNIRLRDRTISRRLAEALNETFEQLAGCAHETMESRRSDPIVIPGVVCVEIRPYDGAQLFESMDPSTPVQHEVVWLTGIDRHPSVQVHDRGRLEYVTTRHRGRYTFIKE